jgi:hypothetical protein
MTLLLQQQKNIMVQLGQQSNPLNTARTALGGAGTQTAAVSFWWSNNRNIAK